MTGGGKQLEKLSIQLEVRDTDWNRFQEKIRKGTQQVYGLGWHADYPDPENFLFLLHGPQARADGAGSNSLELHQPRVRRAFRAMKNMPNSPERQQIIDRMVDIAQRDAPWIFGYHPKDYTLRHRWLANVKPNDMAGNTVQYQRIDPALRAELRRKWNRPVLWPVSAVDPGGSSIPAVSTYRKRNGWPRGPRPDARLHRPARALRDPDPDRGQPHHLRAVLRGQHARRHGAHAPRRKARHARGDREVEAGARYDKDLLWNEKAAGAAKLTDTIFYESR